MLKSPTLVLRDTLDRLDADLATLTSTERHDFLDNLANGLEERLIELIDDPEGAEPLGLLA